MSFFDSFKNSLDLSNNKSPFGEAGLLGDPLHYLVGDKYDNFMRKTWEYPNKYVGQAITKFDTYDRKINPLHKAIDKTEIGGKVADAVHNKPGDSALAVLGAIYGGGSLLSGMGGGASGGGFFGGGAGGGSAGQGLGIFSNGGVGGMGGVGGGNAGALANAGGISGGAGMGSATAGGGFLGSLQQNPQQYLQMMQGMGGQQQQQEQPRPLQPVVIRGRVFWI